MTGASLRYALLGGANLTAVTVTGADFFGADLASARLVDPIGFDAAKNFDQAVNKERLLHERHRIMYLSKILLAKPGLGSGL